MGIVACTTLTKMNSFVVLSALLGATMAAPAADADAQLIAGHGLLGAGYAGVGLAGHGLAYAAAPAVAAAPVAAVHAVPAVNVQAVHTTVPVAVPTATVH